MRRLLALAALASLALPASAVSAEIYWTQADPGHLDRTNVRTLPSGSTLVIADEALAAAQARGLKGIRVPDGRVPYLLELRDGAAELAGLASVTQVLWSDDQFAIVAHDEDSRLLDVLKNRRERLTYIAPVRSESSQIAQAKAVDASLKLSIIDQVTGTRFSQFVRELSGDAFMWLNGGFETVNNRYTHDPEHHLAADYLEDRLLALGYSVVRQNFTVGSTPTQNIVAIKTGTTAPGEILVVGGHYDSTSDSPGTLAPGAEDNATGTAGTLRLAEIFAPYETEKTIHFVAFGGEEQGLLGSQHYVNQASASGDNIIGALTIDMISFRDANAKVIIEGESAWLQLMNIYESNVQDHTTLGWRKDLFSFGSDHVPFQNAGIPAFLAIDWDYPFYPHYHRTTDVFAHLTIDQGVGILRAMAGALADLSVPTDPATATPTRLATSVEQNWPNPFNPITVIPYHLASDGPVKLTVFDLAGRHVRTLVDDMGVAGPAEVTWDGRDQSGRTVGSGLYVYRLETSDHVQSRRMALIK